MSTSHKHNSSAGSQNQGNSLGDRSSVRQSKLYRKYESGNDVKSILGSSNLCWNPDVQEGAYAGQQVFDHMKPNSVSNTNAYDSKYRNADDIRNYVNNNEASYKSMKGNIINNNYNDDYSTSKLLPPTHKGPSRLNNGSNNNIFPNDDQYQQQQQQQVSKYANASGGGNSSSIAAALMGHGQTDYSFRDKKKEVDYNRSKLGSGDDEYYQQQYDNNSARVNAGSKGFTSNMGGLSISQFQQQKSSQPPVKYGSSNGTNSSNIAGALSGYGQEDYSFRSKDRDYSVDPRAYYDQQANDFQIGATKQNQSSRRQSFDNSNCSSSRSALGSNIGNDYANNSNSNNGRRLQQQQQIPGLPSNGAPYGYDDYQYMNGSNNSTNQGNYGNYAAAVDDYQVDDRKAKRESKSTRPW